MFDAHLLITEHGLAGARKLVGTKHERICIEAAAAMLACEGETSEIIYGGLAAVCLPHRRPVAAAREATSWARSFRVVSYRLDTGFDSDGIPFGIPFGAKARMILLWLHDAAIRGKSRIVDVAPSVSSMHAWVRQFGIEAGGMTYRTLLDQAHRIATCNLAIAPGPDESRGPGMPMVDAVVIRDRQIDPRGVHSQVFNPPEIARRVILNPYFFEHIVAEPVALDLRALHLIDDNSWAIDLYVGFAYQLPRLREPISMTWDDFIAQFGVGHKHAHQIKASFLSALPLLRAIYRQARIETGPDGVTIFPSPPPV